MNVETQIIAAITIEDKGKYPRFCSSKANCQAKFEFMGNKIKVVKIQDKRTAVCKDWYVDWSQMNKQKSLHPASLELLNLNKGI